MTSDASYVKSLSYVSEHNYNLKFVEVTCKAYFPIKKHHERYGGPSLPLPFCYLEVRLVGRDHKIFNLKDSKIHLMEIIKCPIQMKARDMPSWRIYYEIDIWV